MLPNPLTALERCPLQKVWAVSCLHLSGMLWPHQAKSDGGKLVAEREEGSQSARLIAKPIS